MPTASAADTARVLSTVLAPIVAQGPILRRPRMLKLAQRLDADRRAGRLLRGLRGKYGPDPLLLRVPGRSVAVVLTHVVSTWFTAISWRHCGGRNFTGRMIEMRPVAAPWSVTCHGDGTTGLPQGRDHLAVTARVLIVV